MEKIYVENVETFASWIDLNDPPLLTSPEAENKLDRGKYCDFSRRYYKYEYSNVLSLASLFN